MNNTQSKIENLLNEKEKLILSNTIKILDVNNELKYNFFALGIREMISVFLTANSNTDEIKACSWYKTFAYNPEANDGVSTKQKLAYIFCGGINVDIIEENLNIDIKNKIYSLEKMYRDLNKYAHINKIIEERYIQNMSEDVLNILYNFLFELISFKEVIYEKYKERVHSVLDEKITFDTLQEFWEIASHYYESIIDYYEIKKVKLTINRILLYIDGNISSKVQYGSDGDYRRGNGLRDEITFPFHTIIEINLSDLFEEYIDVSMLDITKFNIDNSQFFE